MKESFSSHHHCTLLPPTFPPSFQFVVFNVVVQRFEGWFLAGGQGMCRFNRWVFSHRRRSVRLCCCSSWYRNVGFEPGKPDAPSPTVVVGSFPGLFVLHCQILFAGQNFMSVLDLLHHVLWPYLSGSSLLLRVCRCSSTARVELVLISVSF